MCVLFLFVPCRVLAAQFAMLEGDRHLEESRLRGWRMWWWDLVERLGCFLAVCFENLMLIAG